MLHKTAFFCLFFLTACNDSGLYDSLNPPLDGVVVEGFPAEDPTGYISTTQLRAKGQCTTENACKLSLANRTFGTFKVPMSKDFINDLTLNYGIQIQYPILGEDSNMIYIYKMNSGAGGNQILERNNRDFTNGIIGSEKDYNLLYLRNEIYEDILIRGTIPFYKTQIHNENEMYIMFNLKIKLINQTDLNVCSGVLNTQTQELKNPDCLGITINEK